MPRSPPWTDMHLIWHSRRGLRRNHLWQIFWWLVEGCQFCGGSKIALSHWQSQWPLTQGWRYRAACDGWPIYILHPVKSPSLGTIRNSPQMARQIFRHYGDLAKNGTWYIVWRYLMMGSCFDVEPLHFYVLLCFSLPKHTSTQNKLRVCSTTKWVKVLHLGRWQSTWP